MIQIGQEKIFQKRLANRIHFTVGDALHLPFHDNSFDVAAMAFGIRNIPDRQGALGEMLRVVVPGGQVMILEMTFIRNPIFQAFYNVYLNYILPRLAKRFSSNPAAYHYLADSIMNFPTPDEFTALMEGEQGPHLEEAGHRIGVVTGIVGMRSIRFVFRGQQNHAGTTMMARRRDASTALYEFAHRINSEFPKVAAERRVWTMGRVRVEPNAASIVPGYAELDLQFRDPAEAPLDAFEAIVTRLVSEMNDRGGVSIEAIPTRAPIPPTLMDPALRAHIEAAAERHAPGHWQPMPSGAFHDAGIVSASLPAVMLFIPSIGGISHDFAEDSREDDIALGCQVLADAAASILIEANSRP